MTNASFEVELCATLSGQTGITSVVINPLTGSTFKLPECFWTYTTQSTYTSLPNIIIAGSSTGNAAPGVDSADPLLRFSASTSAFFMINVAFVDHTGAPYISDLNAFAAYYTLLRSWTCTSCALDGFKLFDTPPPRLAFVTLPSTGLVGSISASLFSNFAASVSAFSYMLSGNQLNGSIPDSVLANVPATIQTIYLDVSDNRISGTLPPLLQTGSFPILGGLTLYLGGNQLSGSLPSSFFPSHRIQSITLDVSSNALSGEIPVDFGALDACTATLSFSASHNAFTGTAPPFFANIKNCQAGLIAIVSIDLSHNRLSAIAPNFFPNGTVAPQSSLSIDLSHNEISDDLTNFKYGTNPSTAIRIDLSFNNLTNGDVGFTPLSTFALDSPAFQTTTITLDISNNSLGGPLTFAGLSKTQQTKLRSVINGGGFSLFASDNAFTSVVIDDSWSNSIAALDISRNPSLSGGGLPDSLFNSSSFLRLLYAAGTALSGEFPDVASLGSTRLANIDFSDNSGIDFCSENRTAWTRSLVVCLLEHTNAASCSELYPTNCNISAPLPSLAPPPEETPIETPVESPAATPIDAGPRATPLNDPVPFDGVPSEVPTTIPNGVPSAPSPISSTSLASASVMAVILGIVIALSA